VAASGFGNISIFKENLTAAKLCAIYESALLPSAHRLFAGPWALVEDNDPKHRSQIAAAWRKAHGINRLAFPAKSPDLEVMENAWGILQQRVDKRHPTTLSGLAKVIESEWRQLGAGLAHRLLYSMPHRCQAVIEAGGAPTKY
jgi:hypothetical protein